MNITPFTIITASMLVLALALGCGEQTNPEAELLAEITAPEPVLASTTTPTIAEPIADPAREIAEVEPGSRAPDLDVPEQPAAPVPDIAPAEPILDGSDGLVLERFVTTSSVEAREPTGAASTFRPTDERVFAFIEASNDSPEPKTLTVHFFGPDGFVSGGIELEIPASAPRWRTWAYTRHAKKPGLWSVEVRSRDGVLLGVLPFEIEQNE